MRKPISTGAVLKGIPIGRHGAPAEKMRGMSRHASLDTFMIYHHESDRIDNPAEQENIAYE